MGGRVCVVGSLNLDLIGFVAHLPHPGETVLGHGFVQAAGGKGLNQAIAAARSGASVSIVGAVGDDDAGVLLRHLAEAESIEVANLHALAGLPTGRALIAVDESGANQIVVIPGANGALTPSLISSGADALRGASVVLVQQEVPPEAVGTALALAREAGAITILNPAPARSCDPAVLALADIVVPNEHEVASLGDTSGIQVLVVTEGEHGARLIRSGREERVLPYRVAPVDTVAAGDAFCGVLAAALAGGLALDMALDRASAAGALSTQRRGAVPSLPHAAEVDALIARGRG